MSVRVYACVCEREIKKARERERKCLCHAWVLTNARSDDFEHSREIK